MATTLEQSFAIDLHVHSRVSPDGVDQPEVLVARARAAGLHGICITDHDRAGAYRRLVRMGLADPSGEPVDGFLVIPGVEASTVEGHLLIIGTTFDVRPGTRARDVIARAHALGALAVAPHPLDRARAGMGERGMENLDLDAIEGFNSKTLDRPSNHAAQAYARARGLPMIAGSDAHSAATIGRAHTIIRAESLSVQDVLAAVREGRTDLVEGLHSIAEIASYLAVGWITRPWILDMTRRMAANARRRLIDPLAVPSEA
ncbi:MAG: CehA/McbA family metallohydrolase [Phycisphaerales bacterium]|jgi:predicted metal-dependent phosphoesterase TrpH|nr:PHP domain-containing protein [Phycisphaeraceae bacterium]